MDKNILLAKKHLPTYMKYCYPKYIYANHLIEIMEALNKVAKGEIDRLVVNMPPRAGKSLTISTFFPSWYLTNYPDNRIIFATYSGGFAASFGKRVKENITEHPEFGVQIDPAMSHATEFEINNHLGGYKASGVGSSITGRGCDILIIDDPIKNAEESKSSTIRNKIIDWYESTALTRLEPNGGVVLVQTRWSINDLTGHLLETEGDEWTVLNYPALNEKGESFFPQRFSTEQYLKIKKSLSDYWWNALYMNAPVPEGGSFFRPDMINEYKRLDVRIVRKCRAWDIATYDTLDEKRSNYTVGALMYLLSNNKVCIDNLVRFRGTVGEVERKIVDIMGNDDPDVVQVIEQQPGMAGIALKQHWNQIFRKYPVTWVYSNQDKESRALPLANAIETDNFLMRKAGWNKDFIKEMGLFNPIDDFFDDIVDATSLGFNYLNRSRQTLSIDKFKKVNDGLFTLFGR